MQPKRLTPWLSVATQIEEADMATLAGLGFRSIINNRPDREETQQPSSATLDAAAQKVGLNYRHIPVISGQIQANQVDAFAAAIASMPTPILAFCRTGTRSTSLWVLASAPELGAEGVLQTASGAGYDLTTLRPRLGAAKPDVHAAVQVLIVGGGSAGCAVASSLLAREPSLDITIIEPSDKHYYQPAWTLAGGGVFDIAKTEVPTSQVIPRGVTWERAAPTTCCCPSSIASSSATVAGSITSI